MAGTADAVVIGAGIVGASIGLELARRGVRVVVIDGNTQVGHGSTRHSTAIIRSFYSTRPAVALAYEGRKVFESWSDHLGIERPGAQFHAVGCSLVLAEGDESADALCRFMSGAGVHVESLTGREAQALAPGMKLGKSRVLFECGAGFVDKPTAATRDVRRAAEASGAVFVLGEAVTSIASQFVGRTARRRIVEIATSKGQRISTPIAINASGPHSAAVNLIAGAPLPLTTQPLAQRFMQGNVALCKDAAPVVADLVNGFYLRCQGESFRLGTLGARDNIDFVANADMKLKAPDDFRTERQRAFARRYPRVKWTDTKVTSALYDVTVLDWYPILDRTDIDGYYVAVGTSGAWFKGGPSIGHLMAELIMKVEGGHDHDKSPVKVVLPNTGFTFDLGFLSRERSPIRPQMGKGVLG